MHQYGVDMDARFSSPFLPAVVIFEPMSAETEALAKHKTHLD